MDLGLCFIIAIVMAITTWLIGVLWGYGTKQAITTLITLIVVLPIIVIYITGVLGMLHNPEATDEMVAWTIKAIFNYVAENLPSIAVSDIAGIFVGGMISLFTRRKQ